MSDEEAPDWVKNNPSELRAIAGSAFGGFIVTNLFDFMWYEGTRCGVWGEEYSCYGSVWLTLAYVAMLSTALAPGIWGGISMFAKNFTRVNDQQRREVASLAAFGLPFAAIWATIWLYCLPTTWTLLPWGSWDTNWWKIFPYLFGLSWFGLGPLIGTISTVLGKFKEFAETEKQAHEFEEGFKAKLADSTDEGKKFEFREKKNLDASDLPLTKESGEGWRGTAVNQMPGEASTESNPPQFTSILGDMDIHEKYKK
jgi:hypothetical protein